jgi:hypothetical protein
MNSETHDEPLGGFVPAFGAEGYVESRPLLSEWAFRHVWRYHGEAMVRYGAAIKLCGRIHVQPARCDRFLIELGRSRALAATRPAAP